MAWTGQAMRTMDFCKQAVGENAGLAMEHAAKNLHGLGQEAGKLAGPAMHQAGKSLNDLGSPAVTQVGRHIGALGAAYAAMSPTAKTSAAALAGIAGGVVLTGPALGMLGFSAAGPVAGTIASGYQASVGAVSAGSAFATLQSAAMGGFGVPIIYGTAGAVSGAIAGGATFVASLAGAAIE